jgi:hypothetical protein
MYTSDVRQIAQILPSYTITSPFSPTQVPAGAQIRGVRAVITSPPTCVNGNPAPIVATLPAHSYITFV